MMTRQETPTRQNPGMGTHDARPWNPKTNHTPAEAGVWFHLPPRPKRNLRMTEHDARPQKPGMNPTPAEVGVVIFKVSFEPSIKTCDATNQTHTPQTKPANPLDDDQPWYRVRTMRPWYKTVPHTHFGGIQIEARQTQPVTHAQW
ncbi:hypothetical protein BS47DRAFT_1445152 [Hydnum rufescens UP504]|uniref:Uncharacterized protein n=1 Tax=Hydnum rufescens UP504 TaxID=1448309 RepID=A0A9P6AES5_9AGAM|nr:hypothetical protein BS47DRAFT_1445152 [Hydnum rufescens UP504]